MYKLGMNRNEMFFTSLDEHVAEDSIARVVDAFVDSLDLEELGFKYATTKSTGNRPYDPADMLKLYLMGQQVKIRSSRKLEYQTKYNVEFIWLLKGLNPNFRTISDFRKDNHKILKKVFVEFNIDLQNLGYKSTLLSQDGCKVKAVNSKDNNFTPNKLDDRKKRAIEAAEEYLNLLDTSDIEEEFKELSISEKVDYILNDIDNIEFDDDGITKEELFSKLQRCQIKLNKYKTIENKMLMEGASQISLTDPDSRLMKDNDRFTVGYNDQVLVDSDHFVKGFKLTDNPADLGSITDISTEVKETYELDVPTNVTDKGYNKREDMMAAYENGIIPEVTPTRGNDGFILETVYEENEITEEMINSTKPEDLKKCLRSGVIPTAYKDTMTDIEVKEVTTYEVIDEDTASTGLSNDQLRDLAINKGWFTRNIKDNLVFCPMGETLRQKSTNTGRARYCNKLACQLCKKPCCKNREKTIDFAPNQTISVPNGCANKLPKKKKNKKKVVTKKVIIKTKARQELLDMRMGLSEHPHAQMKFWDDNRYLLLKGMEKATGELALYYCGYNIRRLTKIKRINEILEYYRDKKEKKEGRLASNEANSSFFSDITNYLYPKLIYA